MAKRTTRKRSVPNRNKIIAAGYAGISGDHANEPGSVQRNFERNWTRRMQTEHQNGRWTDCSVKRRALRLRFLATGESFRSLLFQFRISRPAISYIVTEVCEAIPKKLGPSYLKVPSSEQERLQIAKQFEEKWNFPNCPGAIDGKHITLQTRALIIITINTREKPRP